MLQMMAVWSEGITVNEDTLAVEAVQEVGPGGHFFGAAHTLERYETAFYRPLVSDWSNYENWRDAGSNDAAQRANGIWKALLSEYEAPRLDPDVHEALSAYVTRRKEELKP
jgi:trimethylamine--corrinoid protein Co-methyltransferase